MMTTDCVSDERALGTCTAAALMLLLLLLLLRKLALFISV